MIPYMTVVHDGKTYPIGPTIGENLGNTVETWRDILVIDQILGFEPVPADLIFDKMALQPGKRYNSGTLRMRDIEIHYNAVQVGEPVKRARRQLHKALPPLKQIILKVYVNPESSGYAAIQGIVERVEPDIFTEDPGETVYIRCPDPVFRTPAKSHQIRGLNLSTGNNHTIEAASGDIWVPMSGYIATSGSPEMQIEFRVDGKLRFRLQNLRSHNTNGYLRYTVNPEKRTVYYGSGTPGEDPETVDPDYNDWEAFRVGAYESVTINTKVAALQGQVNAANSWVDAYYGLNYMEVEL